MLTSSLLHPKVYVNANNQVVKSYEDEDLIDMGMQYLQEAAAMFPIACARFLLAKSVASCWCETSG